MKIFELKKEQTVPRSRDEVFAFFEKPENLSAITPPSMSFRILTPGPIIMRAGTVIDYSVKVLGHHTHWRTLISDYSPPESFVDLQLKGPYTFWHHTHRFIECEGETKIMDEVKYIMPFGLMGRFVHSLFVHHQLEKIFDFRARVIGERFGSGDRNQIASAKENG